jgi:hypothetical protein
LFLVKYKLFNIFIYDAKIYEKIKGATIVASDSIINFGLLIDIFPQVIFSFGVAPL